MQILNNAELTLLSILGRPEVAKSAIKLYAQHVKLFNPFLYPHLSLMMETYMKSLMRAKAAKTKPSLDQIVADITEAVESDRTIDDNLKSSADVLLQRLMASDVPSVEEGQLQLSRMLKREEARRVASLVEDDIDATFEAIDKSWNRAKALVDSVNGDSQVKAHKFKFNPFTSINELTRTMPRVSLGIPWFEKVSHGGPCVGDVWLWLGPSGGGKSAFTVQLACRQALLDNDTVWVTYEQSLKGDLAERMIANITDTSLDLIRDKGFDQLPDYVKEKFNSAVAGALDKLTCLDMTQFEPDPSDPQDTGDIYSVCKQLDKLAEDGKKVKIAIIDWVGAMASRVFARTGGDMAKDFRSFAQKQVMAAADYAKAHDMFFLFFHQTDTEAQHAKPTYCPDMTNARDDHGLCFYFDAVFAQGRRDKHSVCWLNPAKTRKANTQAINLQLIGDRSRFEQVFDWTASRDGNFYNPNEPDDPGTSDEDKQAVPASKSYKRELD